MLSLSRNLEVRPHVIAEFGPRHRWRTRDRIIGQGNWELEKVNIAAKITPLKNAQNALKNAQVSLEKVNECRESITKRGQNLKKLLIDGPIDDPTSTDATGAEHG